MLLLYSGRLFWCKYSTLFVNTVGPRKMNANDEARIILDSLSFLWPDKADIVAWADRQISDSDEVPNWVLELSTLGSPRPADYISILEANASDRRLNLDEKVLMAMDCYSTARLDLSNTLGALNSIWTSQLKLDQCLMEVLDWWEQVDGHGDPISEELEISAHTAFETFRRAHPYLKNPLP